jgi:hypothetical protein
LWATYPANTTSLPCDSKPTPHHLTQRPSQYGLCRTGRLPCVYRQTTVVLQRLQSFYSDYCHFTVSAWPVQDRAPGLVFTHRLQSVCLQLQQASSHCRPHAASESLASHVLVVVCALLLPLRLESFQKASWIFPAMQLDLARGQSPDWPVTRHLLQVTFCVVVRVLLLAVMAVLRGSVCTTTTSSHGSSAW